MSDYESLAVQCEQAAGPDRDLDREIWLTVVADDNQRELVRVGRSLYGDVEAAFRLDRMMDGLAYTASVDAALTLVPEGALWEVGRKVNHPAAAGVPNRAYYAGVGIGGIPAHWEYAKSCATAAALRARGAA